LYDVLLQWSIKGRLNTAFAASIISFYFLENSSLSIKLQILFPKYIWGYLIKFHDPTLSGSHLISWKCGFSFWAMTPCRADVSEIIAIALNMEKQG
jgi:hypothetical protein